jgi:hypothetical protein
MARTQKISSLVAELRARDSDVQGAAIGSANTHHREVQCADCKQNSEVQCVNASIILALLRETEKYTHP